MTTETEMLSLLRRRVAELKSAIAGWLDVLERQTPEREAAHRALADALRTDWKTAVAADPEMTEEQRRYWLEDVHETKR